MTTDLVIILSSDWIGSTQARAQLGEDTADAVQEVHDTLLRRVIAAEGGKVVKHYGDGVMATFNSATAALSAAAKIQADFAAYRESADALTRMEVRVGLAAGDVSHQAGDIFGLPVVEAVRLQGEATPNGILCSDLVRVLSQGRGGFVFEDAGVRELKGIPAPVHAYRVRRPDGPAHITPHADRTGGHSVTAAQPAHAKYLVPLLAAALLLAAGIGWLVLRPATEAPAPQAVADVAPPLQPAASPRIPNSIAVLPFTNLSPAEEAAYFALALHDEVLNQLVKATDLKVTSRTTMARYADTDKSMLDIGAELNVETVMEGSVYRAGDTVRVTMQLIDAQNDVHLWSETYERNVADVATLFAIQADIARNVARALDIELSAGEQAKIAELPTRSTPAYEYYLAALAATGPTAEAHLKVMENIDQAIALDPQFAPAWVVKSTHHTTAQSWFPKDSAMHQRAGEQAARRALQLDPGLASAHAALGYALILMGDWTGGEAAYREARALNMPLGDMPSYALLRLSVGDFAGARDILMETRAVAAQNAIALAFLIDANALLGEWDLAWQQFEFGRRSFPQWNFGVGKMSAWLAGRRDAAGLAALGPLDSPVQDTMVRLLDDAEAARATLARMSTAPDSTDFLSQINIAIWAAYFDEAELALNTLRNSTRENTGAIYLIWLPQFDTIRRTPEFKQLLRDLRIVDYWNTYGWQDVCRKTGADDFECSWVNPSGRR